MANFTNEIFQTHDDYMTPAHAWKDIQHLIHTGKRIWECFYGDGESGRILAGLGFDVIHEQIDFYKENHGEILVSNPLYADCKSVMARLLELNKPFIHDYVCFQAKHTIHENL